MKRLAALCFVFAVRGLLAQSPAPLLFDDRQLWEIKAPAGSLSASERAADVASNLLHAAGDHRVPLDAAREVETGSESTLLLGRYFLFVVTEDDARMEGKTRRELYAERKAIAMEAIRRYRESRSASQLLRSAAFSVGIGMAAALLLLLLLALYRKAIQRLAGLMKRAPTEGRMGVIFQLFRNSVRVIALGLTRMAFLTAACIVVLGALSLILGLFPATRHVSSVALAAAWSACADFARGVIAYLPNLFVLAIVWVFTYALIRVSSLLLGAIGSGAIQVSGFHPEWAAPTQELIRILLILFGLVVAFPYLPGGDSPALRGASIFVGVLVSLGSGSAMGNVIAGVILTYMRPFQVGDFVKMGETSGHVVEKSLLVTRIRTIKNVEVIVPNSSILGNHILNYSAEAAGRGLILHTTVTIGYDAPWPKVHQLLVEAALRTEHILPEPRPFVLQTSLNDFHVSYEINAYTREATRMMDIYSELHRNIQDSFNAGGVEIMSPGFLAVRDGNTVTIPESQRGPGYEAPSFRVKSS